MMPTTDPITVYLDTQDYSRFGDVVRGTARPEVGQIFQSLKELRKRGLACFVYSMPILSELFQYNPEHEDTTLAKARAIEELCGDKALLWLPRLIETQAAAFGRSLGLPLPELALSCVRGGNEWFPRIASELIDLKHKMRISLDSATTKFGPLNRKQRRGLEAHKRDGKLAEAIRAVAPQIADKYGIPVSTVDRAILLLLQGKCTAEKASLLLFGAIAKPTAFVNAYFKVYEGDKSLPQWIRGLGKNLERSLVEFRRNAELLLIGDEQVKYLRSILRADADKIGGAVLRMIDTDEAEQAITVEILESIMKHPDALARIPCCEIASEIVIGYLEQTVAVAGTPAKIERSFGGDLIHALYIDCVDVWRGDRRFSELLKQRLPSRRHKLQPSLKDLPAHIERLALKQTI
jgi:hypothetical protein